MSTIINNNQQHEEEWSETCECGNLMGGKVFYDEEEFDAHPDREPGYAADGKWVCQQCEVGGGMDDDEEEDEDEEEEEMCGVCHKTCTTDDTDDLVLITEINGVKHCDECLHALLAKRAAK